MIAADANHGATLGADRPKETLTDDLLGYAPFAQAIARAVSGLVSTDGIVLAINGPWGSGKTTAADMLVDALSQLEGEGAGKTIVVRFNPWWFSGQEDLVRAFFGEVSGVLGKSVPDSVTSALRSMGRRAAGAKDLVVGVVDLLPGGGLVKGAAGGALQLLGRFSEEDGSLMAARAKLGEALRDNGRRILVVTDDIDRLPPDEVRQIFRLVKSVADLPNVVHLLLFDREIARRALGEDDAGDGPSWLEKIVQAPFDLPPVQPADLHRMLFSGLDRLVPAPTDFDATRWANAFYDAIAPWLRTPRDVGRLLNAVTVSLPAVQGDVDFSDFVALETLRIFEPKLHEFVRNSPELMTGGEPAYKQHECGIGNRLLANVAEPRRDRARTALLRLFPRLAAIWNSYGYDAGFHAKWDAERRVCSERHFPTYFRFAIGNDALSNSELSDFILLLDDPAATRRAVELYAGKPRASGGTRAALLLTDLASNPGRITASRATASDVVSSILGAADLFCGAADERGQEFLSIRPIWKIWWVVAEVLERMSLDVRVDSVARAIETSPTFTGLNFVMYSLSDRLGREPESKQEDGREPLVDAAALDRLEGLYLDRIREAAASRRLLDELSLVETLLRWHKLAGDVEVRAWTSKVLTDDAAVLKLAKAATQVGRSHAEGDRVAREYPEVSREALAKVVDVDGLAERVAAAAAGGDAAAAEIASKFGQGLERRPW